jgi:hypothetical protein
MEDASNDMLAKLIDEIRDDIGAVEQLPPTERAIVHGALADLSVYELAQRYRVTESFVWALLHNTARLARGWPRTVETAGLGADTDPGVTGGYGDSGPGDLTSVPEFPGPEGSSESEERDQKE